MRISFTLVAAVSVLALAASPADARKKIRVLAMSICQLQLGHRRSSRLGLGKHLGCYDSGLERRTGQRIVIRDGDELLRISKGTAAQRKRLLLSLPFILIVN